MCPASPANLTFWGKWWMGVVTVHRLSDLEGCYIEQAAKVYVDGFYKQLSSLTRDRGTLVRFIASSFIPRQFFVAVTDLLKSK